MSQIRNAVLIACSLAAVSGGARAEDESVIQRLTSSGGLSSAVAKKLTAKVGQRMARAADAPPSIMDPLRAALSQALIGSPVPADQMAAAKVRLKLYAGLNEQALEVLFAPHPGAIAACVRDVAATQNECEALVAAAGRSSVAQARSAAGGPAALPMGAAPMAPAYRGAPAAGSRFGGNNNFNSGYRPAGGGYQAAPAAGGYRPAGYGAQPPQQGYAARPGYGYGAQQPSGFGQRPGGYAPPQQQQGYAPPPAYAPQYGAQPGYAPQQQQQAYRPAPAYRPAAPAYAPPPAAPIVTPQEAAARKDAYKAQREAYLARQKQQFDERKAKTGAVVEADAEAAPIAKPAAVAGKASAKVAPAAQEVASADTKRPSAAAAEPDDAPAAPAKGESKPALDNSFLDGLLDDPLGGKGKK